MTLLPGPALDMLRPIMISVWRSASSALVLVLVVVLVLDLGASDVESILWSGLGKAFVPKGRDDSCLAVYCLADAEKIEPSR